MTLPSNLIELAHHLKQESLFVVAQGSNIQKTFEDVRKYSDELFHQSWIVRRQRSGMNKLLFASNTSPKEVCGHNNQLEWTNFVDGYKYLGYQNSKYGEFLKILRENPVYLANCIDNGEKGGAENTQEVLEIIMSAVFGNVVLHEDENLAMQMIKSLAELQLANSDDPRRLIRKGTYSFRLMFLQLFDCLFSAKLFLTAALHEAVMKLMMEDEWFYDIDPGKAFVRFPTAERQKRFGKEGTQQYEEKCREYRKFIVDKLVVLTNRFVSALKHNMHCFPPALGWLISQVYHILLKTGKHDVDKIRVICVDLVYTLFVCPAICNPEPYGITSDIHISHIARHNLMQIAQIIQVLAVSQWEEDAKEKDLYERFEKGCVSSLLDSILQTCSSELPNNSHGNRLQMLSRSSTLITVSQLNTLVSYFRNIIQNGEDDSPEIKLIDEVLNGLPLLLNNSGQNDQCGTPVSTPPDTPSGQRKPEKKKDKELIKLKKNKDDSNATQIEDVIVISLGNDVDCPGMLSEQKVLSWEQENKRRKVTYHEEISNYVSSAEPGEKRTRFSLSQDQESIGNTSDLQEAISEGASSHSVGSVDLENDDFSDMISANVSGRGTPNISGRDTPPSRAGSVEAPVHQLQQENIQPIQLPVTVPKSNGEDVTDRFGKFEIKKEFVPVDETKSTVSDAWSTDVLASDSEPPEQNQFDRLEEIGEEIVRQNLLARNEPLSELSETASDAWSTEASDNEEKRTEELSEFDQDDIGSVITDVSSISGNPGHIEDTPLASGQEPPENLLLDLFGATGSATNLSGATQNKSNKNSNSDATLPSNEASVSVADFPNYFHGIDIYRHGPTESRSANTGSKHTRFQQKIKNTPGNLTLPVPDTNVRTVQSENLGNANGDLIKLTAHDARPKLLQRVTYPLFDNQDNSEEVIPVERRVKISNIEANSVDFGIGGTPRSEINSLNEQTRNIKISEQQNTKFNANRLSLSLSMFDPISNENADENQKLTSSIFVSAENNPTILRAIVDKGNNSTKSKRKTVIIGETMFPNPLKSSNPIDIVLGLNGTDYTDDQRESDDSSNAGSGNSGDEVPFAKSSRSASFDNISQKSEEKGTVELDPEESGKTPTKARSILKSFREKFPRSGQEPPENLLLDLFGATGSATNLSGATQNKSNKNSNSDATLPSNEASVSVADFPNYFHGIDIYRHGPTESRSANTGSKHTRFQQKIKNTPGNLTLPVPDTNVRTVQSENLGNANGDLIKLTAHDARPKLLQRVTYPLFDNQDNSEEVIPVERRVKISNIEANSVDFGIGGTPRSEINSLNEQTRNIKISEQQNTKFNANRLSLSLSMFDPISNENADENQKLTSSIFVSAENNPTILRAIVDKGNNSTKSKRKTVIIGETMFPNPLKSSNPIDIVLGLNGTDYTDDQRESDDSSNAGSGNSGDEVPFAKSSRSASFDNISQKSEEKGTVELDPEESGKTPTKARSILKSFREKFPRSGQEPPENLLLDPFGATGNATNLSGATQNKSNKNSNSDATLPSNEASVSVADFPNYFHGIDIYRHGPTDSRSANTGSKHTRFQQNIKNTPGNLTLPVPDTNVRTVQSENLGNANGDLIKLTAHDARPKLLQRVTYPLSDNQNNSEEVIPVERHVKISNIEANSVDSRIGGTPRSEINSLNEQTRNIKISEQQNTKFNANRLSLSLSMFDPISNENADENQKLTSSIFVSAENNPTILRAIVDKGNNSTKSKRKTVIIGETMFPNPLKSSNPIDIVLGLNGTDYTDDQRESDDSSNAGSGNSGGEVPFAKSSRSASFDNISQKSEEKGTVELDPEESGKTPTKARSILKSFREKFPRSGKKIRKKMTLKRDSVDSIRANSLFYEELPQKPEAAKEETSYDILERYRPKLASAIANSVEGSSSDSSILHTVKEKRLSIKEESQPYYDPNNLENCVLFLDAKRKLRLVLSNCDCDIGQNVLNFGFSYVPSSPKDVNSHRENNELLLLLRSQLAEAINLQNKESLAQLHEAIKCVKLFDSRGCKKLVNVLKDEYQTRTAYISYLIRCQQGLLATQSYVQRLLSRVQRDKSVCNKHLVNVCVTLFIESKEDDVVNFIQEFQKLIVSDNKTDIVERFLQSLYQQMNHNPIWQASTENQMDDARLSIERYIMSRIYTHAMFPNGDGDTMRDQILYQHIKKLGHLITPNHKCLQIPKIYQFECPWTAAQREIYMINVYKTPKDKLKCVHRCSTTIMNLLSMANDKSVPAADEFMPVLIFVIIKANPACLLSTVQYVNSFYGNRLQGEEHYWWMQFSSVVEYIKTMDYSD